MNDQHLDNLRAVRGKQKHTSLKIQYQSNVYLAINFDVKIFSFDMIIKIVSYFTDLSILSRLSF